MGKKIKTPMVATSAAAAAACQERGARLTRPCNLGRHQGAASRCTRRMPSLICRRRCAFRGEVRVRPSSPKVESPRQMAQASPIIPSPITLPMPGMGSTQGIAVKISSDPSSSGASDLIERSLSRWG